MIRLPKALCHAVKLEEGKEVEFAIDKNAIGKHKMQNLFVVWIMKRSQTNEKLKKLI